MGTGAGPRPVQPGMRRLPILVPAVLVVAWAAAACGGDPSTVGAGDGGPATGSSTTAPPAAGAGLVLQIRTGGGFVPPGVVFTAVPELSLYGDGRVIVTGPTTLEYPGRALPNVLEGDAGAAAVPAAVQAAKAAGVTGSPDLGQPAVADAPTTTFVLVDGGRTHRLDAYALGFDNGLTPAQQGARRRLQDLAARMEDLGAAARTPYRAEAVSVLVAPAAEAPPSEPAPGEAAWPLGDLATGGTEQAGGRCLGFTGDDARTVLAAADAARATTRWRSGTALWSLAFRPELSGVAPCMPPGD